MSKTNLITNEDVARICELAYFDIPPDEISEFREQIGRILDYVEKLNELNLNNIEPTLYGQPVKSLYREDAVIPSIENRLVLANAPEHIGTEIKVPKIVE